MKALKWILIILGALILIGVIGFPFLKQQTKKHSPEQTLTYTKNGKDISLFYNRPSKKGREIFGKLVPFGEVWRTGANEPTTFTTKTDLVVGGQALPAGEYTLWTVPGPNEWAVIFNSKQYSWGITFGGKASREPEFDVLTTKIPVQKLPNVVEQFTIVFEDTPALQMTLSWDQTKVSVPIQ